jgi:peptidyl-prolyl cis-trans isomerase SurA
MIKKWLLCLAVVSGINAVAQVAPSEVIMTINDEPVQKQEFEYIFKKNNKDSVISKEDLDEYLELFVNFKLKVKAAEAIGLDKNSDFIKELKGYRNQLTKPYLTDSKLTESLLKEAYDRTVNEVKASHILINVAPDAMPADTLAAYNKAIEVKKKLSSGKVSFEEIAKKYSQDPSAKDNAGNLGYFSAFQMVYPFETAAYSTTIGGISNPIRTSFGYHIVKVTDKRKARGQIRLSHIMLSTQGITEAQQKRIEEKAIELNEMLKKGDSFENIARNYSDDKSTAAKGGVMNWIKGGTMIEEFEDVAFSLKEDGEISAPFKTEYGWHIIRRDEFKPTESYEELLPNLTRKVSRDMRSQTTDKLFIANKKKELGYKLYKSSLKKVVSSLDSTVFDSSFQFVNKVDDSKKLFKLDGKTYTIKTYLIWLDVKAEKNDLLTTWNSWNQAMYSKFIDDFVYSYVDQNLEKNNLDFASLMQEYRDGILLFELTDSLVWSKAVNDTAGLKNYYESHRDDFVWGERVRIEEYICSNKEFEQKVMPLLKSGKSMNQVDSIITNINKLALRIEVNNYEKGKESLPKIVKWEKGIYGPVTNSSQHIIYKVIDFLPSAKKEFKEAKGVITAAYQDYLEDQWLKTLKEQFKVEVNKEVLYSVK